MNRFIATVSRVCTDLKGTKAPFALVDLLFASSGIERELVESAEMIEVWKSVVLPIASLGHLIDPFEKITKN